MLTQEQRDRLEPFTKHERYGQLLIDAIKIWEIAKPANYIFGLNHDSDNWELRSNSCCLIRASLVNKKNMN